MAKQCWSQTVLESGSWGHSVLQTPALVSFCSYLPWNGNLVQAITAIHDLWYEPGPPAEFRWFSMCCLSHWSGQQQHLLQWLQVLGAQEMQWAQALEKDPDYRCTWCQGTACPSDGRPQRKVQVGPDKLEVVASFCYLGLGETLSAAGGCELSTTTRVKTTWKKFKELLPVLSSCHLSFKTCGCGDSSCVWSAMLHANETWPLTKPNLQHLQWNDRAMIR